MFFPNGKQKRFVEYVKQRSGLSWRGFRKSLGIANHVNYRYEACSLPLRVFTRALRLGKVSPRRARRFNYRLVKEPRKFTQTPARDDSLAEFVGICLGDGHLSRLQVAIFGDKSKDTVYLRRHVKPLMQRILKLTPKLNTKRPSENFLLLSSLAVTRYLHKLGLPYGSKIRKGARIPKWIFERKSLLEACLRGLFDTDGCVYGFLRKPPATGSKAIISFEFGKGSFLAKDAQRALGRPGYLPRMMPHRNECRLAVNKDIARFMSEIKPANGKHQDNFARWHGPVV